MVDKLRLNYPQTFLIGFGFSFSLWSVHNAQVPLILSKDFIEQYPNWYTATIDNFGVIFQPLIGAWSDNTRTRSAGECLIALLSIMLFFFYCSFTTSLMGFYDHHHCLQFNYGFMRPVISLMRMSPFCGEETDHQYDGRTG